MSSALNATAVQTSFRKPAWPLRSFYAFPTAGSPDEASERSSQVPIMVAESDVKVLLQGRAVPAFADNSATGLLERVGTTDGHTLSEHRPKVTFGQHLGETYSNTVPAATTGSAQKTFTQRVRAKLQEKTPYKVLSAPCCTCAVSSPPHTTAVFPKVEAIAVCRRR